MAEPTNKPDTPVPGSEKPTGPVQGTASQMPGSTNPNAPDYNANKDPDPKAPGADRSIDEFPPNQAAVAGPLTGPDQASDAAKARQAEPADPSARVTTGPEGWSTGQTPIVMTGPPPEPTDPNRLITRLVLLPEDRGEINFFGQQGRVQYEVTTDYHDCAKVKVTGPASIVDRVATASRQYFREAWNGR